MANPRRLTRVSLRLLLALLTLVCLWAGKLSIDARRQKAAVEWVEDRGGLVRYDWQVDRQTNKLLTRENPTPAWLRTAFGDHCFQTAVAVSLMQPVEGSDYSTLAELPEVGFLQLSGTKIANLAPLASMKKLEVLLLGDNEIVDLRPLAELRQLKDLYLDNNKIVDLTPLSSLDRLATLVASNNQVIDLSPIGRLPNLTALDMSHNPIADLTPLSTLLRIEMVRITNGQIVDCSPLLKLPTLFVADLNGNQGLSPEDDRQLQEYMGRVRD